MPYLSRCKARVKLVYSVLCKKTKINSIQHTIINENLLAIMKVCLPILTSVRAYSTGYDSLDLI